MVNDLLQEGHMVLLTGSKFYRGPPFSGVCLVDHQKMAQLKQSGSGLAAGLNSFIGKANLPAELPRWRDSLENSTNPGLALRWEAALAEMEATLKIDEDKRISAIANWNKSVVAMMDKYENLDFFAAA